MDHCTSGRESSRATFIALTSDQLGKTCLAHTGMVTGLQTPHDAILVLVSICWMYMFFFLWKFFRARLFKQNVRPHYRYIPVALCVSHMSICSCKHALTQAWKISSIGVQYIKSLASYNAIFRYSGYSSAESNSFIQPRMHLRL